MAHPAGEAETGDLRVDFDRRLRLERQGAAESASTPNPVAQCHPIRQSCPQSAFSWGPSGKCRLGNVR